MIVVHVAPICWDRPSGPAVSIPALVRAQNKIPGVRAALVNSLVEEEQDHASDLPLFGYRAVLGNWRDMGLPFPYNRPDLVVFHSTYVPRHAALSWRLRRMGVPYVICPRGGMTRHALAHHGWKKRIGDLLFFRRFVAGARAVQFLTGREAAQSPRWGRPCFVVGNGVDVPSQAACVDELPWPLRLAFIGRLAVYYKGLDLLLEAAEQVAAVLRQRRAQLAFYGPDWDNGEAWLRRRIRRAGLADLVSLHGPVWGQAKQTALKASTVFVSTSRSEGHSMAVLEALAWGRPCLLTPGTNMAEEVARAGAGWHVPPTVEGIAAGIVRLLQAPPEAIRQAGQAARRLAEQKYAWPAIAARSVELYRRYAA